MTPKEIIDKVLGELSRPDLADDILAEFPKILRLVHSIERFNFDLETYFIPNPTILDSTVRLPVSINFPRLRDVDVIKSYQSYTGTGTEIDPYVGVLPHNITWLQASSGRPLTDYFGYIHAATYFKMNNNFTLKGVQADTALIEISAISWPTWTYNDMSDEYETTSWICVEFPAIVEAQIKLVVYRIAQSDEGIREAQIEIETSKTSFLRAFAGDIYHAG